MVILITALIFLVAIVILTGIFGASLFLVEDISESSFKTDGQLVTWGKCAAIVVATTMLQAFVPLGGLLSLVLFFIAVMSFFQKTFVQAFLLLVINGLFKMGIFWLIGRALAALIPETN